jgi:hypothetical protein
MKEKYRPLWLPSLYLLSRSLSFLFPYYNILYIITTKFIEKIFFIKHWKGTQLTKNVKSKHLKIKKIDL